MGTIEKDIREHLLSLCDPEYKEFQSKLVPNIDKSSIIGIRTPKLREYAKEVSKASDIDIFLSSLPHKYYEENNLHGFLIEQIKDYDKCIFELNRFLGYIDNWATCDTISPKVLRKNTDKLILEIRTWLCSKHVYTVRFGAEMLMKYYLDEKFDIEYPKLVADIRSDEYYIKMMVAWYFATALAKQYDAVIPYIEQKRLDNWTHNKTIQKAIESYRISDEQKAYLRTLKIK